MVSTIVRKMSGKELKFMFKANLFSFGFHSRTWASLLYATHTLKFSSPLESAEKYIVSKTDHFSNNQLTSQVIGE